MSATTDQSTTITDAPNASTAVALWWAEQLGAPTFRASGQDDSPQDRANMDMAAMMAQLIVGPDGLTQEQATKFVAVLSEKVEANLAAHPEWGMYLDVDYGPCLVLADAAEAAGIPLSRFPWKTHTSASPDFVTVALGYGSQQQLIWSAPGWVRPTCGTRRYTDDWSEKLPEVCGLLKFHDEREHGSWTPKEVDA
jgi:hypothetical protein